MGRSALARQLSTSARGLPSSSFHSSALLLALTDGTLPSLCRLSVSAGDRVVDRASLLCSLRCSVFRCTCRLVSPVVCTCTVSCTLLRGTLHSFRSDCCAAVHGAVKYKK